MDKSTGLPLRRLEQIEVLLALCWRSPRGAIQGGVTRDRLCSLQEMGETFHFWRYTVEGGIKPVTIGIADSWGIGWILTKWAEASNNNR
jgi:hypothetical protein